MYRRIRCLRWSRSSSRYAHESTIWLRKEKIWVKVFKQNYKKLVSHRRARCVRHHDWQFSTCRVKSIKRESREHAGHSIATAAESEERSDKIAEDFLDSSLAIDEFLEQFKPSRTEMHLRKLKADKMQELLRHGTGNRPPPQQMKYPPGINNFYGGSPPYPNANIGGYPMMPMPPNYRPF